GVMNTFAPGPVQPCQSPMSSRLLSLNFMSFIRSLISSSVSSLPSTHIRVSPSSLHTRVERGARGASGGDGGEGGEGGEGGVGGTGASYESKSPLSVTSPSFTSTDLRAPSRQMPNAIARPGAVSRTRSRSCSGVVTLRLL